MKALVLVLALLVSHCAAPGTHVPREASYDQCISGNGDSCFTYAESRANSSDALVAYQFGCELGHAPSCREFGLIQGSEQFEGDAVSGEALESACDSGDVQACMATIDSLSRTRALEVLRKGCDEDLGLACVELARRERNALRLRGRLHEAIELEQRGCTLGAWQGCLAAGQALVFGSGIETDTTAGLDLLERACAQDPQGCEVLAHIFEDGLNVEADSERAQAYRARARDHEIKPEAASRSLFVANAQACARGVGPGCFNAAQMRRDGVEVEQNPATARDLYSIGCSLEVDAACKVSEGRAAVNYVPANGSLAEDGWPMRSAESTLTCPKHTDLQDTTTRRGRTVTCLARPEIAKRGFEQVWTPSGALERTTRFDDSGHPVRIERFYVDGSKRSVDVYEDGLLQRRETWFESGTPKEKQIRSDDVIELTRWEADGSVVAQGTIVGEQRQGDWKEWRDGAFEFSSYVDGVQQGDVERRYLDSSVERGQVVGGRRQGTWERVDSKEAPMLSATYRDGVLHGPWTQHHPNRQIAISGEYVDGKEHGRWSWHFADGIKRTEGTFRCGLRHGAWTWWHRSGAVERRGEYVAGEKDGTWIERSEAGRVLKEETFEAPDADPCESD